MIYDVDNVLPPKDRKILVQLVDDLGCCDHTWHEVYFDESINEGELEVYDEFGIYHGKIWCWKEVEDEN